MNVELPDQETVHAALSLAARAPSVHNSQPWKWRVGHESAQLYADSERHLPHTDPARRDLILSCGAALQHFGVGMAALGWQTHVRRMPDPSEPDHLATIEFCGRGGSEQDIALAAAIPRRRSDRRIYSSWPVPGGDIALMAARAARLGVTLRRVKTGQISRMLAAAVRQRSDDAEYLAELAHWSGRVADDVGVPARNTPAVDALAAFPARRFASPDLAQPAGVDARDDAGIVVALGTATDDPLTVLRAGEATGAVLLTATALGLSSCPLTDPLEVPKTRALVRTAVLGGDCEPQMLLRIGWAPINADPLPATPRRPLNDMVTALDGAPIR